MRIAVLSILFLLLLTNCSKQDVELRHDFKNNTWAMNKVKLEYDNSDIDNTYQLILEVSLLDKYSSNDFSIALTQQNDDGETRFSSYSVEVKDKMGDFINDKNATGQYTYTIMLNPKAVFYSKGRYEFNFEHRMSTAFVKGIESINLKIIQL